MAAEPEVNISAIAQLERFTNEIGQQSVSFNTETAHSHTPVL